MGSPVFLVENFFSAGTLGQFPDHVVSAEEEPVGNEAWRVATGRRDADLNKWTASTANSDSYLNVVCDRTRAANTLILDGHNLAGYGFELRGSQDNWTTYETILDVTIPSVSAPGDIDDAAGVLTEEGAWVVRFDARAYTYWRVFSNAMGADLLPEIAWAVLGMSYSPDYVDKPVDVETTDLFAGESVSEDGWLGRGDATRAQAGTINITLSSFIEYDLARYHLNGLFAKGYPMWYLQDEAQAERAFAVVRPKARFGFKYDQQWGYERANIPYIEHQPSETR